MNCYFWTPDQLVGFGDLLDYRFRGNYLNQRQKEVNIDFDTSEGSYGLAVFFMNYEDFRAGNGAMLFSNQMKLRATNMTQIALQDSKQVFFS